MCSDCAFYLNLLISDHLFNVLFLCIDCLRLKQASKMFSDVLVAVAVVLAKVPDAWKPDRFSFRWTIIAYIQNMENTPSHAPLPVQGAQWGAKQGAGSGLPTPLLSHVIFFRSPPSLNAWNTVSPTGHIDKLWSREPAFFFKPVLTWLPFAFCLQRCFTVWIQSIDQK